MIELWLISGRRNFMMSGLNRTLTIQAVAYMAADAIINKYQIQDFCSDDEHGVAMESDGAGRAP
jgi:hypothetical protein